MPHHAIEIEGPRRTHVDLNRGHFRHFTNQVGDLVGPVGCFSQGSPFRHVDHHGKLGLIVQRQHLDRHDLEIEHGAGQQERAPHNQLEPARFFRMLDHGDQYPAIQLLQGFRFRVLPLFSRFQVMHGGTEYTVYRQPRGEHESGKQGDQHGNRTQCRNGHHIGSHHTADESHGQQGTDNGKGCQNGRITHFPDRINGSGHIGRALFQPAAIDIFNHHDSIIDQDADGEYERKEGDPVDGEAHHQCTKNREQQNNRDNQQNHDGGLQRTESEPDQQEHETGCHEQLEYQRVNLVLGGLSVIPGDAYFHVLRDQPAFELVQSVDDLVGDRNPVSALFLGYGNRNRRYADRPVRYFVCSSRVIGHHVLGVFRSLAHLSYIIHIDWHPVMAAHFQIIDIVNGVQEFACHHRQVRTG